MKKGIVLEGGALRAIFSSGVCDALLEQDVMPDYLVGVSAGIAYGVDSRSRRGTGKYSALPVFRLVTTASTWPGQASKAS